MSKQQNFKSSNLAKKTGVTRQVPDKWILAFKRASDNKDGEVTDVDFEEVK